MHDLAFAASRCDCAHMHISVKQLHVHVLLTPHTHIQAMVSCYSALHRSPSQEPQWYICQNSSCPGTIQPGVYQTTLPVYLYMYNIHPPPPFSCSSSLLPPFLPSLLRFPLSSSFSCFSHIGSFHGCPTGSVSSYSPWPKWISGILPPSLPAEEVHTFTCIYIYTSVYMASKT